MLFGLVALLGLFCVMGLARGALDLPVDILQSHQVFKDSELVVSIDGHRMSSLRLTFRGKTRVLPEEAIAGLEQPDLSSIQVKLVGAQKCEPENACLDDSLPLVEIKVAGIREEPICAECTAWIDVSFLCTEDHVIRRATSRKPGGLTFYPARDFVVHPG